MTQHFVVSYEIDDVHRVSVGIEAESPEACSATITLSGRRQLS